MVTLSRQFNQEDGDSFDVNKLESDIDAIMTAINNGLDTENVKTMIDLDNITIDQAIATAFSNLGPLVTILSWYAQVLKAIKGTTNWYDDAADTIAGINTRIAGNDTDITNLQNNKSDASTVYTKTNMQTSGQAQVHWNNLTNVPNMADASWKPAVAIYNDLPTTNNVIDDMRVVADDGDFKSAIYRCKASTGTIAEQWEKLADLDWTNDHSKLINLSNDDHPQYLLTNGTRAIAANLDFAKFEALNMVEHNVTAFPSNPQIGQRVYHTTKKKSYVYKGGGIGWEESAGLGIRRQSFTASLDGTETFTLTEGIYDVGANTLLVFIDGKISNHIEIIETQFSATVTTGQEVIAWWLESGTTYNEEPQYSTPVTETSSVISLPSNTVKGQVNALKILGRSIYDYKDNGIDYANWAVVGTGTTKGVNGIHLVQDGVNEYAELPINLQPNKQYTLIINITDYTLSSYFVFDQSSWITTIKGIIPSLGINKITFTTNSSISTNKFRFAIASDNADGEYVDFELYAILEGDYTADDSVNKPFKFGVNSTFSDSGDSIKSVGKNLCPIKEYTVDKDNAGIATFMVKPNTEYTASASAVTGSGDSQLKLIQLDENLQSVNTDFHWFVNAGALSFTRITASNTKYIRIEADFVTTPITVKDIQFEKGATATAYEEYKFSENYPPVLRSLPNGVEDEINDSGEFIQRTKKDNDISGTDYDSLFTSYVNIDIVKTTAFTDISSLTSGIDNKTRYYDKNGVELQEVAFSGIDNANNVGKYFVDNATNQLWIIVAKGAYVDIASARTDLGTTSLIYQLAEPVITEGAITPLTCFENGTLIVNSTVLPEIEYSVPINIAAQRNSNTDGINQLSKAVNDLDTKTVKQINSLTEVSGILRINEADDTTPTYTEFETTGTGTTIKQYDEVSEITTTLATLTSNDIDFGVPLKVTSKDVYHKGMMQSGLDIVSVNAGASTGYLDITFPQAFSSVPKVIATVNDNGVYNVHVYNITTTGFRLDVGQIHNSTSDIKSVPVAWIAVE